MATVLDVARYVIKKCGTMTAMKLEKLVYYCQAWSLAWDEVPLFEDEMKTSGGRSQGNNSHFESVSDLIPEAQQRWRDLKFDEYDRVFSLRLTNIQRIYGILDKGVLSVVWFDPKHEIYQVKK